MRTSGASLVMLAWMSILAALVHVKVERSMTTELSFLTVELMCLVAGALEAGRIESGKDVEGRRVIQAMALLITVGYLVASTVVKVL